MGGEGVMRAAENSERLGVDGLELLELIPKRSSRTVRRRYPCFGDCQRARERLDGVDGV
jgi:hypothetical protein